MELYLMDSGFDICSQPLDDFESLTWTERWSEPGSFVLHLGAEHFNELAAAVYVYNPEAARCAVIERLEMDASDQRGKMIAKGRTLECLLDRRVIDKAVVLEDAPLESSVRSMVTTYALTGDRAIPGLSLGAPIGLTDAVSIATEGGDKLGDTLFKALEALGASFRVDYDFLGNTCKFALVRPVDRAVGNSGDISPVIFSRSFENVSGDKYSWDQTGLANVAYVVSDNDEFYGVMRETVSTQTPEDPRVEIFVKSKANSEPVEIDTSTGKQRVPTVSRSECAALMRQEGAEALLGKDTAESVSADVVDSGTYRYRVDYAVGDIVSYASPILGVQIDVPISEVEEVYENGGKTVSIKLGSDFSAVAILRRIISGRK